MTTVDLEQVSIELQAKIAEYDKLRAGWEDAQRDTQRALSEETALLNRLNDAAKECLALYEQLGIKPR